MAESIHTQLQERGRESLRNLSQKGVRLLSPEESASFSSQFRQEMLSGIESKSKDPNALKMYPSHISPRGEKPLPVGMNALVGEVGGTNAYWAVMTSNEAGELEVATGKDGQKLLVKNPLRERSEDGKREYKNPEDFFGELVDRMGNLLENAPHIDALGVVYSFPGEAVITKQGVDVISPEDLPKDFVIPDISKQTLEDGREQPRYIGKSLLDTLRSRFPDADISSDIPVMVGNDTVAVGLSKAGSKIGGVIGTGFNLAVAAEIGGELQYLNTEAGASTSVPETELFLTIGGDNTKRSTNPAERQISGISLGQYLDASAAYLTREGVLPNRKLSGDTHKPYQLGPETVTSLLEGDHATVSEAFVRPLSPEEFGLIHEVAQTISDRSAQVAGIMIGTMVDTFAETFPEENIFVPIEGSIFWKIPGYKEKVAHYAQEIVPQKLFNFGEVETEQAGTKGMGAVALEQLNNRVTAAIVHEEVFDPIRLQIVTGEGDTIVRRARRQWFVA